MNGVAVVKQRYSAVRITRISHMFLRLRNVLDTGSMKVKGPYAYMNFYPW